LTKIRSTGKYILKVLVWSVHSLAMGHPFMTSTPRGMVSGWGGRLDMGWESTRLHYNDNYYSQISALGPEGHCT